MKECFIMKNNLFFSEGPINATYNPAQCGIKNVGGTLRIVGGRQARRGSWPFLVSVVSILCLFLYSTSLHNYLLHSLFLLFTLLDANLK